MKAIRIDSAHIEKIQAAIDAAQCKARVRCITAQEVLRFCDRVASHLSITKKAMNRVRFTADLNAQLYPSAYRGIPQSTVFCAEYRRNCWYLTDVFRGNQYSTRRVSLVTLTDDAKAAILESASAIYD